MNVPLAVIDLGSNSGRLLVVEPSGGGLRVLAEARSPLRLAEDLQAGSLSPQAISRTVSAVADFAAIADAAGARRTLAVATSAVRESSNSGTLVEAVRTATGVEVEVISGDDEARAAFNGSIHALDIDDGLVLDIGGGSAELIRFAKREIIESWTLPLGCLRLARRYLTAAPAVAGEVRDLRKHVSSTLAATGVDVLTEGETLVGTGGTLRTLAKIDRRVHGSPIGRLHGHSVPRETVDEVSARLASLSQPGVRAVPGVSEDRTDSVVAGFIIAAELMRRLGASSVMVSGHGLREGLALQTLGMTGVLPESVRAQAVEVFAQRFAPESYPLAQARTHLVESLMDVLVPHASSLMREMTRLAALALDAGSALDHYNRAEQSADLVLRADLPGFNHSVRALLSLLLTGSHRAKSGPKSLRRLLSRPDQQCLPQATATLALADQLCKRLKPADAAKVTVAVEAKRVVIHAPCPAGRWAALVAERIMEATGRTLVIERSQI